MQSEAIFAYFTEKSNVENIVIDYSNMLIKAAKSLDRNITGIEAFKRWQKLKMYKMFLEKYLRKEKIELFHQKIKLSMGIQLKLPF